MRQGQDLMTVTARIHPVLPGVLLCSVLAAAAWLMQALGKPLAHSLMPDALVLAILLGVLVRNTTKLRPEVQPGISLTSKQVLELAVALLGVSVSFPVLFQAGGVLLGAVLAVVSVSIVCSRLIGRWFGLNPKLAVLVACGNSICGNSAIAAVAPVIEASPDDVASAIALTAVLGVLLVLGLPLLIQVLHLTFYQYGVLAGLTVYAVPQVVAAAFPVSALSGQIATLVKLVRVLLLGPVVLFFAVQHTSQANAQASAQASTQPTDATTTKRPSLSQLVPWFIIAFLGLAALRSLGLLPTAATAPVQELSKWLTIASMAALGLGVDIQAVKKVGWRVGATVLCSLLTLVALSILAIKVLHL